MKILLDTNILLHREANRVINKDIGVLFNWLDKLHYEKCISPLSIQEIKKYKNPQVVETIKTKIENYNVLKTQAPETKEIEEIRKNDENKNDEIDTSLVKEVFAKRVDYLITEDKGIHKKAALLNIEHLVFSISDFLEKVTIENPELSDYKVLSVKKIYFGDLNIEDSFFDSFRNDYPEFNNWFNGKSESYAFVSLNERKIVAFLYIKTEGHENYNDITPVFKIKKRLKIGTFKVISTGHKLGERFLRISFVEALKNNVDEIYITIFNRTEEQKSLIFLLKNWGFEKHGKKNTEECVYIKNFRPIPDKIDPKLTYPFLNKQCKYFLCPIDPQYHTDLLPDSVLRTENVKAFSESKTHRNAIQKVYISRSINQDIQTGDIILFYRTGGFYKSVITTIALTDKVIHSIKDEKDFIELCRKRSVFSDEDLKIQWGKTAQNGQWYKPFIVNFLYIDHMPKRLNMEKLIQLNIIKNVDSAPRGFEPITKEEFELILKESKANERFIID